MSVFDNIRSMKAPLEMSINVNEVQCTRGYSINFTTETVQFSCVNEAGRNDYFLIILNGSVHFDTQGTLAQDYWKFKITPSLSLEQGCILIDRAPTTTQGSTTISKGCSTTVSGTVGFFGDEGTGSLSVSGTQSSSYSYSVPDVVVYDLCYQNCKNGAEWKFKFSENSTTQEGNLPVQLQALFMVDRNTDLSQGKFDIAVEFTVGVSDHDGEHGTSWFDRFHGDCQCFLDGSNFTYDDDRIGHIDFKPWKLTCKIPPEP